MQISSGEKHSARSAEARLRVARAAALSECAATRADGEADVILAGARAHLWLAAGIDRHASEALISELCRDFGTATVLAAAVALCVEQPPGPLAWLRKACEQRAAQ